MEERNGKYCREESKAETADNWNSIKLTEKQLTFQHRQVVLNFPHEVRKGN